MKICFIGSVSSTFVKRDYEILQKNFNVTVIEPPSTKQGWIKYPHKIKTVIGKSDVSLGWFAGWHTLPMVYYSRKNKKKSVVIVGGYDATYIPEMKYGAFTNTKERIPAKYTLTKADLLLPVSNFTKKEILQQVNPKKIKVIYNAIDTNIFKQKGKKMDYIVSIGNNIKLKGLDTFIKVSRHFPDVKFVVIGTESKELQKINPDVILTGKISHNEVLSWLQKAKVYCQLSYMESFGVAIAEAMACECIPVVTKRGGIPEVVGDTGFYVTFGNEKEIADAIQKALNSSEKKGAKARERIIKNFSIKKREEELIHLIKRLANDL